MAESTSVIVESTARPAGGARRDYGAFTGMDAEG
jgi:hypothetical protein